MPLCRVSRILLVLQMRANHRSVVLRHTSTKTLLMKLDAKSSSYVKTARKQLLLASTCIIIISIWGKLLAFNCSLGIGTFQTKPIMTMTNNSNDNTIATGPNSEAFAIGKADSPSKGHDGKPPPNTTSANLFTSTSPPLDLNVIRRILKSQPIESLHRLIENSALEV